MRWGSELQRLRRHLAVMSPQKAKSSSLTSLDPAPWFSLTTSFGFTPGGASRMILALRTSRLMECRLSSRSPVVESGSFAQCLAGIGLRSSSERSCQSLPYAAMHCRLSSVSLL